LLTYDPYTGLFTWLVDAYSNKVKGKIAGSIKEGYINISIDRKLYRAHRLAWLYVNGVFPSEIDHINRVKSDNRICNLREVSRSENCQNRSTSKRVKNNA